MYYGYTNKRPLGANDFPPKAHFYRPNYAWVKYAVTVLLAIALRFLCCA